MLGEEEVSTVSYLRRSRTVIRRAFAMAAALVVATLGEAPAGAHDNWLEVEPFFAPTAGKAKVYLFTGEQFEEAELLTVRRRERFSKFQVVSAMGRRDATGDLREDQQPLAVLNAEARTMGTFILGLDAAPRDIEIEAKHFQEYLLEERLIDALLWRAGTGKEDAAGRERYSRCIKALVQIGPKLDAVATQAIGQEIESVPSAHPYSIVAGGVLEVQVLFRGKPLAGRALTAANRFRSDITRKTVRTDGSGKASFILARGGDWMFRLVHTEPASGEVDWRGYWANLTFSLPDVPAPAPRPTRD